MPPALLILDPQNDFFGDDNPNLAGFEQTVPAVNAAIDLFHRQNWPVIVVQHISAAKPEGSLAWKVFDAFQVSAADHRLVKRSKDAFDCTPLNAMLKELQVDRLVIAGYITEHCVAATYQTAGRLGYRSSILADGTASLDAAARNTIQTMHPVLAAQLAALLQGERKINNG